MIEMLTVGSLFSGIGGFDLGLERTGMRVIWQSEIDHYASAVLKKHWPNVPNHGDIRSIRAEAVESPDVLCGGFPCQDISIAGRRAGMVGEHSGLWSEFSRLIRELRPKYVIVENSPSLCVRGMGDILGDLAHAGYDAEWEGIPAASIGAIHLRARQWVLAYPCSVGDGAQKDPLLAGWNATQHGDWWSSKPSVCRVDDGIPNRVDRLKCLGNAIVPQIAEIIGKAILTCA